MKKQTHWDYKINVNMGVGNTANVEKYRIVGTGDYVTDENRLTVWLDDEVIFQTTAPFTLIRAQREDS